MTRTTASPDRLARRFTLLRARRGCVYDPDQRYFESAPRTRIARRVRVLLRKQEPVFLLAPRWSRPDRFLDELASDLLVGRPRVVAHVVPLGVIHGRSSEEAQGYVLRCVAEAADLDPTAAASQPVSRAGFRGMLGDMLSRTVGGPRRALLLLGIEHLDIEIVQDLYDALREHAAEHPFERSFNLLFSGSVAISKTRFPDLGQLILPDFGPDEAVQAVYEYVEGVPERDVELAAALVGGVPALLHAVGVQGEKSRVLPTTQEQVWEVLGPLADEVQAAVAIVAADQAQAERLELLTREGSLPVEPAIDGRLVRAGLVRGVPRVRRPRVVVRAPILAQLVGSALSQATDDTPFQAS